MKVWLLVLAVAALALLLLRAAAPPEPGVQDRLARHRNLGKAFYENPTTQNEAVEEFAKALKLAPDSARERLNYGLALLRAGKTSEGVAELLKVQKEEPEIPHTWFNLGIVYKKQGEHEKAIEQFERMVKLAPSEPISHYNLGALYKLVGKQEEAIRQFEMSAKLDPNLAASRFQLFNAYRTSGRPAEAKRELEVFQRLKKQQEGAAIPEDVDWNAYAEVYDIMEDRPPSSLPLEAKFQTRQLGAASGAVAIEANGDGRPELLVWSPDGLRLEPGGKVLDFKGIRKAVPGDFNNDGLMDVAILTADGAQLYVNQKGKFEKFDAELPQGVFETAVWLDYDHDYDLDLILLGSKSYLLRNQGDAGFQDRTADFPFVEGEALDAAWFRVAPDTKGMDLLVSYKEREGVLYRDLLAGKFEAIPVPLKAEARSITPADVDNDGWFDVVYAAGDRVELLKNKDGAFAATEAITQQGPTDALLLADLGNRGLLDLVAGGKVFANTGSGKFAMESRPAGIPACSAMDQADFNFDGRIDVACLADGAMHLATNQTSSGNQWIRVKLQGVKNLKLSPGAEVEVKAGPRYQKKIYAGFPLLFGLGDQKEVDTVRITWPNGLIQNEMKQPAGKTGAYQEAQRLSGSCPMIWSWNGREFEYITDVLGVAPLGASAGDGAYFPVDHDEYIQIGGKSLKPVNGHYEIRITEELSEVAYLDQVKLIAVDHPKPLEVFTNEKFKGPPFPEFRLFGVEKRIYPTAARDAENRDVLRKILAKDRTYPDSFPRTLSGVAGMHSLELDFDPSAAHSKEAVLILSGWVDWADGSTFLGVAQEGRGGLVPPYLQVKDANGEWKTVIEDMGMPAGKPKTIAVDLTGKWLSESRAIRIVTNLCVYWDEIFLSEETGEPQHRLGTLPTTVAGLRFRGFSPNRIHPERKQPESFTYAGPTPTSLWNPTPGLYTRYGDVRELTREVDDKFVIMGSGDELRLLFNAQELPELPDGWTRDFLLLVDGWAKDRDANTAYSQSTEPLPFHGMSQFPYPPTERYPDTEEHRRYRETYNTRPALRLIRPLASR